MSKTVVTVLVIAGVALVGLVVYTKLSAPQRPAVSGGVGAGPAPAGVGRSGNKVTNTINDVLSFAKQGESIFNNWNSGPKSL